MPRRWPRVSLDCTGDKILTKQSFKNECDINKIMAKYRRTGVLSPDILSKRQEQFGDVSEIGDFHTSQNKVIAAQDAFDHLPADIRSRFKNDPGELLDFCADPGNREEAIELGIIQSVDEELPPTEVPPQPPTPAPEPPTT